jgi:signal transduction histidine kinase
MSRAQRWRQAFDRIGGPDAVTWPAFWITLVASLVGNLTTGGEISTPIWVRLLVVAATQIAMFIPLVLLRFTLLRNPPRPRPWVAIAGFAVACVVRGVVISALLVAVGAVQQPLYLYRIASSFISIGLLLFLLALVISALRAHTRSLEQLLAIQRDLTDVQGRIVAELTERNEEALERVKARLADELTQMERSTGHGSVMELQRLASDVVRPLSHELAASLPHQEFQASPVTVRVTWRQAIEQMATGSALRPVQTAALMAVIMSVAAIGLFGFLGVQLMAAISASILILSFLANRVLRWLLPRTPTGFGIAVFILASLIVGFGSSAVAAWVMRGTGLSTVFAIAGGVYLFGIISIVAMVNAVLGQQRQSEVTLTALTAALRREVVRLGQAQWLQRKALSRALHGPVQSAVTSAALRLDQALRAGEPTSELIDEVRDHLRSIVDTLETDLTQSTSIELAMQRIIGTWEGVCAVQVNIDTDAEQHLAHDPLALSAVIDILTDAVSNAVRHANATEVRIRVESTPPDLVALEVVDNGEPTQSAPTSAGLGTQLLEECTLAWSRCHAGSEHALRADVPIVIPA